jgi:hypothetical protein
MKKFKRKIEGDSSDKEYNFECYENTELIEIGDVYIFFFGGIAVVGICRSENEKLEINPNDRVRNFDTIDLVTGFWKNCYKIISTDYDLNKINF